MRIYVDLQTMNLVETPDKKKAITLLEMKRGTTATLDLAFIDTTSARVLNISNPSEYVLGWPEGTRIIFSAKTAGEFTGPALVFSDNFLVTGPSTKATGEAVGYGCGVDAINVTSSGSGYTATPAVTIISADGNGSGAAATATLSKGVVTGVRLLSGGYGYDGVPEVRFSGGGGSGAVGTVVMNGGSVSQILITQPGSGYTSAPTVSLIGGVAHCSGTSVLGSGGSAGTVTSIVLTDSGMCYTSAPTVALTGGGGTGATATATMSGGRVTGFIITSAGSGYSTPPTVGVTGGGISPATATAQLTPPIFNGVSVTMPGSGYGSSPIITLSLAGQADNLSATARVVNGRIISIDLPAPLSFPSTPTVTISGGGGSGAAAVAVFEQHSFSTPLIDNPGSGYNHVPSVTLINCGNARAVASVTNGRVSNINLIDRGLLATGVPIARISGGSGSGATAEVTTGPSAISEFSVTAPGSGYSLTPQVSFTGGGGSGAAATAVLNHEGSVVDLKITNRGSNYTSAPTATLTGSNTTPAVFKVELPYRSFELTVLNRGSGYHGLPQPLITGGGGSGALLTYAHAVQYQMTRREIVTSLRHAIGDIYESELPQLIAGGSGYHSCPDFNFYLLGATQPLLEWPILRSPGYTYSSYGIPRGVVTLEGAVITIALGGTGYHSSTYASIQRDGMANLLVPATVVGGVVTAVDISNALSANAFNDKRTTARTVTLIDPTGAGTGANATWNASASRVSKIHWEFDGELDMYGKKRTRFAYTASAYESGDIPGPFIYRSVPITAKLKLNGVVVHTFQTTLSVGADGGLETGNGKAKTITPSYSGNFDAVDLTVESPYGSGAVLAASLVPADGSIHFIQVWNKGMGYNASPRVFAPGGVVVGHAVVSSGAVVGVSPVASPPKFSSAPVLTIEGSGGAAVTATLSPPEVTGVRVINGGAGYNPVEVTIDGDGSGATATANVVNGSIANIIITNNGTGYTTSPEIIIPAPFSENGVRASARCTLVGGKVTAITVTNQGSGYLTIPLVFTGGGGSGASGFAYTRAGAVVSAHLVSRGSGYTSMPEVEVGGTGIGADVQLLTNDIGVAGATVTSAGSGYVTGQEPSVSLVGGGGFGATARAVLSNGRISSIHLDSQGSGYTSTPSVLIESKTGMLASAEAAILPIGVASVTVTQRGSGYTANPSVLIDGDGSGALATAKLSTSSVITGIEITSEGRGYLSAPSVTISAPTGLPAPESNESLLDSRDLTKDFSDRWRPAQIEVILETNGEWVLGGNTTSPVSGKPVPYYYAGLKISKMIIKDPGTGYLRPPDFIVNAGGVTTICGKIHEGEVVVLYIKNKQTLYNQKKGYYSGETIKSETITMSITGPDPTPDIITTSGDVDNTPKNTNPLLSKTATAKASMLNGSVSGVTITNPGSQYLLRPTVVFSDPAPGYSGMVSLNGSSLNTALGNSGPVKSRHIDLDAEIEVRAPSSSLVAAYALVSNVVTVTTATPHQLENNDSVKINAVSGALTDQDEVMVTKTSDTVFTFPLTASNTSGSLEVIPIRVFSTKTVTLRVHNDVNKGGEFEPT